jgi:hypothetical protein
MVRLNPYRFLRSRHRQLHSVLANMSDFSKAPQIIDYGGRRRQFDRRQTNLNGQRSRIADPVDSAEAASIGAALKTMPGSKSKPNGGRILSDSER